MLQLIANFNQSLMIWRRSSRCRMEGMAGNALKHCPFPQCAPIWLETGGARGEPRAACMSGGVFRPTIQDRRWNTAYETQEPKRTGSRAGLSLPVGCVSMVSKLDAGGMMSPSSVMFPVSFRLWLRKSVSFVHSFTMRFLPSCAVTTEGGGGQ